MKTLLEQQPFFDTFLWVAFYCCLMLVTLYIVTIVWLTITHIWSIAKFLTQYIFVTAKLWIQRLFGVKAEIQPSISETLELSDLEIHCDSTTENKTAQRTSLKPKSTQVGKQRSLKKERG